MSLIRPSHLGCCLFVLCAMPVTVCGEEVPAKGPKRSENIRPIALFRAADTDKNGLVTWEELKALRPAFPEARFKQLDKNGSGAIERTEVPRPQPAKANGNNNGIGQDDRIRYVSKLIAAHDRDQSGDVTLAEIQADKPGFPKDTFGALDRDKNGTLGSADLPPSAPKVKKKAAPAPQPNASSKATPRQKLQEADSNKDGKISFEEARVVFPKMTQSRFEQRDRNGDGYISREDRPNKQ